MKIKANKFLQHGAWLVVGTLSGQLANKAALSSKILTIDTLQSPLGISIGFLGSYIGICMARIYIDSLKKDGADGNIIEGSIGRNNEKEESLKELEFETQPTGFFSPKPPRVRW